MFATLPAEGLAVAAAVGIGLIVRICLLTSNYTDLFLLAKRCRGLNPCLNSLTFFGGFIVRTFCFCLAIASLLSACNTVQGIGKDLEKGGEAIQRVGK